MSDSKPETIDLAKARELLAAAVETQGRDFVYNPGGAGDCLYRPMTEEDGVAPDDPRAKTPCLVGTALDIHGETRHRESTENISYLAMDLGLTTEATTDYFQRAQYAQDQGKTWGQAFDEAEEFAEGEEDPEVGA